MPEHGLGVPRDYARAMIWYRTAAEQGDAFAQMLQLGAKCIFGPRRAREMQD